MKPNQGIQKSGWNALIIGLFTLLGTGLACPLSLTLATSFSLFVDDPNLVPLFALLGLIIGLLAGAVLGWRQGGADYLAHYRLRYHLWKSGATPWRYVHFLEEAAERVLLHRVGSGYRYVHPLFQEYFASLEPSWSNLPNIKKVFTNLKVMSLVFLPILCLLIVFGSLGLWNVYQTQSTALVYQKLYQQATSGMPVLDDTLNQQSKNNWDLHRSPSQSCGFRNGSYHASTIHSAVVCPELSQQFDNFALQVNMTLTGDVGGIFFRIENDTDGYIFYIDKELELCAFARVRDSIFLTKFTCILNSPGYTEITLIIRKSSFYSYMNGHFIGYATDSALKGSGLIGFGADDRHHSTDATYSHVKIWQL
ncbi:MAG TPA: hypothetical protein VFV38_17005 [Ktedonobacteraceae bacterium]|nr:hypothetical protein [Ktedonobacteraceae bacterium]